MGHNIPPPLLLAREHPPTLPRLDRDAALHRIRAGVYVRRGAWDALAPWERYRMRVLAVARTWEDPVLVLESAAVLLGLPIFGEPRDVHVLARTGGSWREGDVVVHRSSDERKLVSVAGIRMTSVEDTTIDLCRVLPPAFGLAVADAGGRCTGMRPIPVATIGRAQSNRRGVRRLDWVQERTDPLAESAGESVSRAVIEWLGYEEPELQVRFRYEGHDDRTDFYWRHAGVIGESDGYGKYDASDPAKAHAALIREKTREDRLRRHEPGFARWDWADTISWRQLDAKLGSARLFPVGPSQLAMLSTLAHNPRSLSAGPEESTA